MTKPESHSGQLCSQTLPPSHFSFSYGIFSESLDDLGHPLNPAPPSQGLVDPLSPEILLREECLHCGWAPGRKKFLSMLRAQSFSKRSLRADCVPGPVGIGEPHTRTHSHILTTHSHTPHTHTHTCAHVPSLIDTKRILVILILNLLRLISKWPKMPLTEGRAMTFLSPHSLRQIPLHEETVC